MTEKSPLPYGARFISPRDGSHYFFGYFGKPAIAHDGRRHLAHRVGFIDRQPSADDVATVGWFALTDGDNKFVPLGKTRAWNWQQGSMLQAVGEDAVIHNDRREGRFVAVLRDWHGVELRVLPNSVYDLNRRGTHAVCVDFERHFWCRPGYCYAGIENQEKNNPADPEDGLWMMEVDSGTTQRIVTLRAVMSLSPVSSMRDAWHYLEHAAFSPDGRQIAFLHRWKTSDGDIFTRLLTCNVATGALHLLHRTGRLTHFAWKDNQQIVAWCAIPNVFNLLRQGKLAARWLFRPLLPAYRALARRSAVVGALTGDQYCIVDTKDQTVKPLGLPALDRDGHPSFHSGLEHIMLTDTYPVQEDGHRQRLVLADLSSGKVDEIARISHPEHFHDSMLRCDLHPRWSQCAQLISVDAFVGEARVIMVFDSSLRSA